MAALDDIIEALRARRIRASRSAVAPGFDGIALAMGMFDLERFLDTLVTPPPSPDDELAVRIVGRPGDLGPEDEPWRFEVVPGFSDAGFEMRAYVSIPDHDVLEVLARLSDVH